jgi:RNA polymerase sigma-70 factor (ECF subfamily)
LASPLKAAESAFVTDGTDQELAIAAAAGDRTAFATVIDRHYDRVHRLAWRWCGSREGAEDIAQDVVVKLATAIRSFRGESRFSTWLFRLAYTVAIDHMRARQRIVGLPPSNVMMMVEEAGAETPETAVMGQELWAAVRSLPDRERDAVLLVYGEDLSHGEAAAVMGCSEKTVSWHLHEARKRLKTRLEATG